MPDENDLAALVDRLFHEIARYGVQRIGCVWPLPGEVDLRGLCFRLQKVGKDVLLPETTPPGNPLIFRQWSPNGRMLAGRFGTSYPEGQEALPELVLVPMLAFDRSGRRLGYGGGYYDRTLEGLKAPSIGYAMAVQERPSLPVDFHDIPMSRIVTERETIHIKNERKV